MAKQNKHFAHFSVGEYSAAGLARVDVERTLLAAEVQENVFPHAVGKGQVRPGTTYLGATPDGQRARLIPFVRDIDDVALIEMSEGSLRVWVDDALITRAAVTSTVTNGDFSSATGWTLSATSGAHATISGGKLTMDADARGSLAYCAQSVSTSSAGIEHALRIVITRGPVLFRCGSTSGGQEYIRETSLDAGVHSIAFTPTASPYYIRFLTRDQRDCIVDSVTVEAEGIMELTAPWTEAQLREIAFDQSADVIFLAHTGWQQRKIERRSTTSWSLAVYQSNNGPFTFPPLGISVKPASTYGNTTLTANKPYFDPSMVGSLVRLYHPNLKGTWRLGGDGEFTDIFQVRGIKGERFNDRTFYYQVSGSWSGTMRVQRSLTGPDGDFVDYNIDDGVTATTFTSNRSVTHVGQEEDNNILSYFRIGFIDNAYNSGNAVVSIQHTGFGGYGIGRITGYVSQTKVNIEVLENFNSTDYTDSFEIGQWSNYYGWPSAVALFDGRLWWGGTDTFWGSKSDAYYTFDDLESGDSASIKRQVATGGQINQINWFLPLQRLLIGTTGSIASARASSFDEPLTPLGVTVKDAATFGGSTVSPIKVDSRGVFVHRSGESVYGLLYTVDANDYAPKDLTGNSGGICGDGIVEIAASREPETFVWCVREDGQIAMLIYEYAEGLNVQGWSRFVTNGVVESVCVLPGTTEDTVYLEVDRTDAPDVVTTGAEILARGESAAWDFTDQSIYVLDSITPANNENSYGAQTDGYGNPYGADANILSYTATNECDPKIELLETGYLGYQPNNLLKHSEDLSNSEWLTENTWVSSETYEAPDGTMTARKVCMQNTGSSAFHYFYSPTIDRVFDLAPGPSPGYVAAAQMVAVEVSFWAKAQTRSSSWGGWIGATLFGSTSGTLGGVFNVQTVNPLDFNYDPSQSTFTGGQYYAYFATGLYSALPRETIVIEEVEGEGGWNRYSFIGMTAAPDLYIRFSFFSGSSETEYDSNQFIGDDNSGPLIWGVQVAQIPTASTHQGQISPYVKTSDNARVLLPYVYDSTGSRKGIRVESATSNILSHDLYFEAEPWTESNASLGTREGGVAGPMLIRNATILTESGATSPHYLEYQFVGPNDLYVFSIYVLASELNNVGLHLISATDDRYFANFNIENGLVVDEIATGATNTRSGIELLPSGWARVWISSDIIVNPPITFSTAGTSTATFGRGGSVLTSPGTGTTTFRPTGWSNLTAGGTTSASWDGVTASLPAAPTNYITNGSFETGDKTGWSNTYSLYSVTTPTGFYAALAPLTDGLSYFCSCYTSTQDFLYQDIHVTDSGMFTSGEISAGTAMIDVAYSYASTLITCARYVRVYALNAAKSIISTLSNTTTYVAATNTWYEDGVSGLTLPSTTVYIRISLSCQKSSGTFYNMLYDAVQLTKSVDPGLTTLLNNNSSTASFVSLPQPAITTSGTSSATFLSESTVTSDLSSAGVATTDIIPSVGTMTASGSASVSFDVSNIIISSAIVSTNAATGIFYDDNIVATTLTDAGTSTTSFVGSEKTTISLLRVYLVDSDEPVINAYDSPVHESTGSSLQIWGAQLEWGRNAPSSYRPVFAGLRNRATDVYNTPLTDVPWDQTQATLYVQAEQTDPNASGSLGTEDTAPVFGVDSGGDDVHFLRSDTASDMRYEILNNGTVEASIDGGTWTLDTTFELASSATTNDARLVVDHGTATQDTSVTMPTIPQAGSLVVFGHSDDGAYGFDGIIKRAALIMDTSTDDELQDLGNPEDLPSMRFIEKINLRSEAIGGTITKMADAGVYAAGPVSSVTAAWLAERTNLVGWGTKVSDGLQYPLTGLSADTSGVIALGDTYTGVFVGLGYDGRYKTGKLAYAATGGTALLQRKRVGEMSLLLANTHRDAVRFGADFDTMRKMDLIKGGTVQAATTVNAVYDETGFSFPGEWNTDARLCLKVSAPYPCTFLGLVIAVETNERGLG